MKIKFRFTASFLALVSLLVPNLVNAALTVGATSITTDSTLSLQGGNVGIGDSTPDQLLEISSSAATNTQFTIKNTNASDFDPQIGFQLVDGTNSYTVGVDDSDSNKFKISSTALGAVDFLIIEDASTRDVGIGVSNPAGQLHISDTTTVTDIYVSNSTSGVTANDGIIIQLANSDAVLFNQESGHLLLGSGSADIYLLNNGNIGINTSGPTELLDINSNNIRIRTAKTPTSATEACDQGEISWDTNFIYVCVATNTWKRSAISTW